MPSKHTTISIPYPLYKKIKELIKGTGFTSASDFVTFVLRDVLIESKEKNPAQKKRAEVVERLKKLGYI